MQAQSNMLIKIVVYSVSFVKVNKLIVSLTTKWKEWRAQSARYYTGVYANTIFFLTSVPPTKQRRMI